MNKFGKNTWWVLHREIDKIRTMKQLDMDIFFHVITCLFISFTVIVIQC